jgi:membrane protease YdiL (CAAX protease family)
MTNPRGVIAYLILAFGIAWVSWEIPIRLYHLDVTSPQFQMWAIPGAFAPAIAALLVRTFSKGGWKDAKFKLPIFSKWPYFLFALLLPIAGAIVVAFEAKAWGYAPANFDVVSALQGVVPADTTTGQGQAMAAQVAKLGPLLIPSMMLTAIITTPILWGEEFGWRGYLQPRLFPGNPVLSAIVTGVIWSVWHFPLILRGYDFGHEQAVLGCATLTGGTILLSFIFAWLVEKTGSIWSSSLAHAATNGVGASLTLVWLGGQNKVMTLYTGVLSWLPLLVVCLLILLFDYRKRNAGTAESAA